MTTPRPLLRRFTGIRPSLLTLTLILNVVWSWSYQQHRRPILRNPSWLLSSSASPASCNEDIILSPTATEKSTISRSNHHAANTHNGNKKNAKIILWRGEKAHGNDLQFRQLEFTSALAARRPERKTEIDFSPALSSNFTMPEEMDEYEQMHIRRGEKNAPTSYLPSDEDIIMTVQWCSLVQSLIEIVIERGHIQN